MNISPELLGELIAHALEDPDNEVCGVVAVEPAQPAGAGGANGERRPRALSVMRATNVYASPLRFQIDAAELLRLWNECQQIGELGAIYHSHVRSPPYPSQTDINFAANWPGVEWIIVGLAGGAAPEARSYLIEDGEVTEVPLEVP
jgi:[CysO sulfur-carrier protein]-S-L-cysteine hydrolase